MPSYVVINNKNLVIASDNNEDYCAAMDFIRVLPFLYRLDAEDLGQCFYKIAVEDPANYRMLIEDISGELDPKTGNLKGIDQFLAQNPPCNVLRKIEDTSVESHPKTAEDQSLSSKPFYTVLIKEASPFIEGVSPASSKTVEDAIKWAESLPL